MDDELEIDLRKVIRSLLQRWVWIVGFGLLVGVLAFGVSYAQSRHYQASAIISLRRPLFQPNFDSRYQTLNPVSLNSKIVSDIAISDEIVQQILASLDQDSTITIDQLRKKHIEVEQGSDPSVVVLNVRWDNPERAIRLVNFWAKIVVERINELYSARDNTQVQYFVQQAEIAQKKLETSQREITEFQGQNRENLLVTQLTGQLDLKKELIRRQHLIQYVKRDTQTLLSEYSRLSESQILSPSDRNKLLFLQMRIYADSTSSNLTSIQFQVSSSDFQSEPLNLKTFREEIQAWLNALETQSQEIQDKIEQNDQDILDLQLQIADLRSKQETLQRKKDVALEAFLTLSRKYQEALLSVGDDSLNIANLGSQAVMTFLTPRNLVRNSVLGAVVGILLAIFGVLIWDWWRSEEEQAATAGQESPARQPVAAQR